MSKTQRLINESNLIKSPGLGYILANLDFSDQFASTATKPVQFFRNERVYTVEPQLDN